MVVMPSNSSGWFMHCLARETGNLGHLFSPGGQRGPWPWFPYALDNGAFSCWDRKLNVFDDSKWVRGLPDWHKLLQWASGNDQKPLWAIVPDVPGNRERTLAQWYWYAQVVLHHRIPLAVAVQDGMTLYDVKGLDPQPEVVAIGGSDEYKWGSVRMWAKHWPRVHVLRCNSPTKLDLLEELGVESCDGTGWNRGDRKQTAGFEAFVRRRPRPWTTDLTPFVCRGEKKGTVS